MVTDITWLHYLNLFAQTGRASQSEPLDEFEWQCQDDTFKRTVIALMESELAASAAEAARVNDKPETEVVPW
jgi:hypothetical protein